MEHIVLDLDGALIKAKFTSKHPSIRHNGVTDGDMFMYFRPGTVAFLRKCFATYKTVSIWTAAQPCWLNTFLDALDREDPTLRPNFLFTWDWRRVTEHPNTPCGTRLLYTKDLAKMWLDPLGVEAGMSSSNVFLLDDNMDNSRLWPDNFTHIPTWKNIELQDDTVLEDMATQLGMLKTVAETII